MKKIILILMSSVLLISCQSTSNYNKLDKNVNSNKYYPINFTFYNDFSSKKTKLTLENFIAIPKYNSIKKVIIIENQIHSKDFKDYKTACENYMVINPESRMLCYQNEELNALRFFDEPENFIVIDVSKNLKFKTSSYYTSGDVTKYVQKNHQGFRITVINTKDKKILLQSNKPIDAQALIKVLKSK